MYPFFEFFFTFRHRQQHRLFFLVLYGNSDPISIMCMYFLLHVFLDIYFVIFLFYYFLLLFTFYRLLFSSRQYFSGYHFYIWSGILLIWDLKPLTIIVILLILGWVAAILFYIFYLKCFLLDILTFISLEMKKTFHLHFFLLFIITCKLLKTIIVLTFLLIFRLTSVFFQN